MREQLPWLARGLQHYLYQAAFSPLHQLYSTIPLPRTSPTLSNLSTNSIFPLYHLPHSSGRMATSTTLTTPITLILIILELSTPPHEPSKSKAPYTRLQAQEYVAKHFPKTPAQLQKQVKKNLQFFNTLLPLPTNNSLWELFQEYFRLWSLHNFKILSNNSSTKLRLYLRCGGVFVQQDNIAQALYKTANEPKQHTWTYNNIASCKKDLKKGPITSF